MDWGVGYERTTKVKTKPGFRGIRHWDSGSADDRGGGGCGEKRGLRAGHVRSETHLRHPSGGAE